jgi:hypothetical protein
MLPSEAIELGTVVELHSNVLRFTEFYQFTKIYGCRISIFKAVNGNIFIDFTAVDSKLYGHKSLVELAQFREQSAPPDRLPQNARRFQ